MRLLVTTPMAVVLDVDGVTHVRAEDATGSFGIRPGHDAFLTVLAVSVVSWRDAAGAERHVAVRGGLLTVRGGDTVQIATRDAAGEDTLQRLGDAVLDRFRADEDAERAARLSTSRLQLALARHLTRYLRPGQRLPGNGASHRRRATARREAGG